ncbi:hypothetical protein BTO20_13395 [Mycobacterium dioxanotrophicus]|uniref:DUF3043 domain-containing protein n=1 Tax=Mycobacterium dioxanotrophicus TaxID=482462 RepID=A0A1Y0C2Y1_9MYCO|nr:DUF3043 domain-containing protein [Mycobacterium dioxanotrophicus]ART69446.1 hypothetical protein BTO20_13395 [Mycobacterium dioxanotrophicus]
MNLLGRKKRDDGENDEAKGSAAEASDTTIGGGTAPKGRPTPKRNEGAKKRGPVAPAPQTAAEARRRRKELRGPKLTGEERKAEKLTRRAEMAERREKMMSGDDAYLLPRDKGPVRRYVRNIVDSRRNLLGLFMPAALVMIVFMMALPSLQFQQIMSYTMLGLVVIMAIDGVLVGRKVNRMVDEKFPGNTESGWKLGFYAASRASQIRRMRAPRPAVSRGDKVS